MGVWPEITTAKSENRHEIKLAGAAISKRISDDGLDKSLFKLINLNLLTISDTSLMTIPDDIKQLINLQSLLLYGNKLSEFNENITSLPKLKVLDLSRNELKTIPDSLNKMKELTSINFSSNQIEEMPKFYDFPNLIIVDLSNNKLKSFLDTEEASLPHLTDLKLNGNEIDVIPTHISRTLPSLKNFDIGDNKLKMIPGEVASLTKLKELNLKGNKLSDNRLKKLVDQCRTKQVVDYIREHCPSSDNTQSSKKKGKKGKKQEEEPQCEVSELSHLIKILRVEEALKIVSHEGEMKDVRPYIVCCIVRDLNLDDLLFKKLIKMQTRFHSDVCGNRTNATIATHDYSKIPPGNLLYTAKLPSKLTLVPLGRTKSYTGEQLVEALTEEAENMRKQQKKNSYLGIHKYLYLLKDLPKYACLEDSSGRVISFPPITNAEGTKMSAESKSMLVEVTSSLHIEQCKDVMNKFLEECLLLGIGDTPDSDFHSLVLEQVKVVSTEGDLRSVYPARTDCAYASGIRVIRMPK